MWLSYLVRVFSTSIVVCRVITLDWGTFRIQQIADYSVLEGWHGTQAEE